MPQRQGMQYQAPTGALAIEPLEAALLREAGEGNEHVAAPPPVLRPSILSGAFVRVRFDDAYRLERIGSTQLTADGRIVARLQVTGRCAALTSLSRGSPLEDGAAAWQQQEGQQELAALVAALAQQLPTCWEIAAACCRLSTAWQWAQHPSVFAAALQRGLPWVAAQLEDPTAVEAVMRCVEPAAPTAAPSDPAAAAAAAAAAEFLAAVAAQPVQPVQPAAATEFAAAAALAVPTPAQPAPLSTSTLAGQNPAAAAAAGDDGHWDAVGGSGQWEAPPQQYRRVVTLVPDPAEQQRLKREREDGGSPPGKRPRSEASPAPLRSVDRFLEGSLADSKRRQIEDDVPPGSRREALLVQAVERSCPAGQERQAGDLGNALRSLDSDWRARLGFHSITDLLLALSERGLVRVKFRGHPHGSMNAFYSRASGPIPQPAAKSAHARADERPPAPVPAASADRSRLAADVPPGSRREALLVQAVQNSCPAGQERQGGDLGIALGRLDRDWKQQLGGHSITNLLLEMDRRGLVRAEVRKDGKGSGINVFYSRVSSRSSQAAAKPADARARERPPAPAAQPAGSRQLAAAMPPGSSKEALLVQAVAEQNSRQPGQALAVANLGEVLRRMDSDWKARLGLNDLVWELHRRGLVRAEMQIGPTGSGNLFFTNLRC